MAKNVQIIPASGSIQFIESSPSKTVDFTFDNTTGDLYVASTEITILEVKPTGIIIGNNVKTFINISTDKAADPTSILGKTKLIAEQLTAGYADLEKQCKFVSVRFGNVFGSRGSVLQTFSKQIEMGAPITITDPKVERYFMTLEESVHLVLQAATQGESGDTLILKMGKPILIKTIADKLIKMSGKNIEIKFSSLRPGEKLSELLIGKNEKELNSYGEETLRVKVDPVAWADVPKIWNKLLNSSIIGQNQE